MTIDDAIRILSPETTADALAEIEYYGGFSGQEAVVKAVKDACRMGVAALERSRWTPVSERLPEAEKPVLATDGEFVGAMYINNRGKWQRCNVNDYRLTMALDILWWMPLPEPPEKGGDGDG